jgi:mono/diheme cytochrome c family protein
MEWFRLLRSTAAGAVLLVVGCVGAPASPPVAARPLAQVSTVTVTAPTNEQLWQLSRNPAIVKSGALAFQSSSCGTCHGPTLTGGVGPNLADHRWLHGGTPRDVYQTISRGIPSKGMPTWGPVLGPQMVSEIVAFIFSHHQEGEPIFKPIEVVD